MMGVKRIIQDTPSTCCRDGTNPALRHSHTTMGTSYDETRLITRATRKSTGMRPAPPNPHGGNFPLIPQEFRGGVLPYFLDVLSSTFEDIQILAGEHSPSVPVSTF